MADDSVFAPLLTDVYGLFGAAHSPTEPPPPPQDVLKPPSAELKLLSTLDPPMRDLTVRFLRAAREAGHEIQLIPPVIESFGQRLERAAENMADTALHQMGVIADQARKAALKELEAVGRDVSSAEQQLMRVIRVAYIDPHTKRPTPKKATDPNRWRELAHLAQRTGLKAGFFGGVQDASHFEHPVKPAPKVDSGPSAPFSGNIDKGKVRDTACELIKKFEGCYKVIGHNTVAAYPDPGTGGDPWTIGWGSTGSDIKKGTVWSIQQCEQRFAQDVEKFMGKVVALVTVPLATESWAALISFAYNAGSGALKKSTLLQKVNAKDWEGAANEFPKWNKGGGKVLPGLVKRRAAEQELFLKGVAAMKGVKVPAGTPAPPLSAFPAKPTFPPLDSDAQKKAAFGEFRYEAAPTADNPENIKILDGWVGQNIVKVKLPKFGTAWVNQRIVNQMTGLWAAWEAAGLLDRIVTFDGAFCARFQRGSKKYLSNHSWGSAFDINAAFNRLGTEPAAPGQKGCVYDLVPLANQWGFYWGGHFGSRKDGMHFEVAVVGMQPAK